MANTIPRMTAKEFTDFLECASIMHEVSVVNNELIVVEITHPNYDYQCERFEECKKYFYFQKDNNEVGA